jgi:hypothetical protein
MGSLRKPLVLVDGKIQRLQGTDYIQEANYITLLNNESPALTFGDTVYLSITGECARAIADNTDVAIKIVGMVTNSSVTSGNPASIIQSGVLKGTEAQWENAFQLTPSSGGLVAGTIYYLSDGTVGKGTGTPVETVSHYHVKLGIALTSTDFLVDIKEPILL